MGKLYFFFRQGVNETKKVRNPWFKDIAVGARGLRFDALDSQISTVATAVKFGAVTPGVKPRRWTLHSLQASMIHDANVLAAFDSSLLPKR